jgi:hypothetical protein
MHTERRLGILEFGKLFVTLAALAGFFVMSGAPRVQANEEGCEHRTEKADHDLHEAVKHHGYDSRQAEHARHELTAAREYCWNENHKWWDADGHQWRTEHNWDEEHGRP